MRNADHFLGPLFVLVAACGGQTATGGSSSSDSGARRDAGPHTSRDSGPRDALSDAIMRLVDASDSATQDDGPLNVGSPCNTDRDCHPASVNGSPLACVGGSFTGGYCAVVPTECSGGGCPSGTACLGNPNNMDVDGGRFNTEDLCGKVCAGQGDCRDGYACCNASDRGTVCVPPSLCPPGEG